MSTTTQATMAQILETLNANVANDFSEIEDFICGKVEKWATVGNPQAGPDSCGVLVELAGQVSVIEWLSGDIYREESFGIYSASELVDLLNRCYAETGSGFNFVIEAAADTATNLGFGRWGVEFGNDSAIIVRTGQWHIEEEK